MTAARSERVSLSLLHTATTARTFGRVTLLVGDVEAGQGLAEADGEDGQEGAEDGRLLHGEVGQHFVVGSVRASRTHLEHAPDDVEHDGEEVKRVERREELGPCGRRLTASARPASGGQHRDEGEDAQTRGAATESHWKASMR